MGEANAGGYDFEHATTRAVASFEAIRKARIYSEKLCLFGRRRLLAKRRYEHLWPFADAWSASCTLSSVAPRHVTPAVLASFFDGLAAYHPLHDNVYRASAPVGFDSSVVAPLGPGGDVFYDDNAWLGLASVLHDGVNGDARALPLAERLFEFVVSGWSTDPAFKHPGGIRWKLDASNRSRNTCSNAPAAELAALLHERTGDERPLEWSIRIYEWVRRSLLGSGDLYLDRIDPDGTTEPTVWSYNQGTMIGAGILLHRSTGESTYLEHASATAAAAIDRFDVEALLGQAAAFNSVFFRNLFMLEELSLDAARQELAVSYADAMWDKRRIPATGLFSRGSSVLNDSASMIEIYALLAGAPPHP